MSGDPIRSQSAANVLLVVIGGVLAIFFFAGLKTDSVRFARPVLVIGMGVPFAATRLLHRYGTSLSTLATRVGETRCGRAGVIALLGVLLAGRLLFVYLPPSTQTTIFVGMSGIAIGMVALGVSRTASRTLR